MTSSLNTRVYFFRSDRGTATQTFAWGGKHPRAATVHKVDEKLLFTLPE